MQKWLKWNVTKWLQKFKNWAFEVFRKNVFKNLIVECRNVELTGFNYLIKLQFKEIQQSHKSENKGFDKILIMSLIWTTLGADM